MLEDKLSRTTATAEQPLALPSDRLERLSGWGDAYKGVSYVYRPSTTEDLQRVFEIARSSGRSV
ncbi:MAG: hypothetical protein KC421_25690, partial [Anaerolineales bacterium]|nr:hypothetical protein [Anaerolineales bacterium]